jgi:hypothetical protein
MRSLIASELPVEFQIIEAEGEGLTSIQFAWLLDYEIGGLSLLGYDSHPRERRRATWIEATTR